MCSIHDCARPTTLSSENTRFTDCLDAEDCPLHRVYTCKACKKKLGYELISRISDSNGAVLDVLAHHYSERHFFTAVYDDVISIGSSNTAYNEVLYNDREFSIFLLKTFPQLFGLRPNFDKIVMPPDTITLIHIIKNQSFSCKVCGLDYDCMPCYIMYKKHIANCRG